MRAAHVRAIVRTAAPRVSGHTQDRALHLVNMKTANHTDYGKGKNVGGVQTRARQGKVKLLELGAQLKISPSGWWVVNMSGNGVRVDRFILP